jgi:hypothetical protein
MFQVQLVYQSCPVLPFHPQPVARIICIFHSANYLSSSFEVSKPFKSFLGKVLAV